jgi:DNA polymerase-3 subunit delta'
MSFDKILGQERALRTLTSALEGNRLAQAYLFHGPPGVGKELTAFELARTVNCTASGPDACGVCAACKRISKLQHPDVQYIFPVPGGYPPGIPSERPTALKPEEFVEILKQKVEKPHLPAGFTQKTSIGIDWIKHIRSEAAYHLYEGKRKVFIVRQADAMTTEAANAFLKVLEEPTPQTLFILTTTQPQALLPTILSRCQQVRFSPLDETVLELILTGTFGLEPGEARLVSRLAGGSVSLALEFTGEEMQDIRAQAWRFFELVHTTDMLPLFELEREIVQGRNVQTIERFLRILFSFYRDMLVIKGQQREQVANLDYLPRLESAGQRYSTPALAQAMQEINLAAEMIVRNVNLRLLIISLHGKLAGLYAGREEKAVRQ